MANPTTPKKDDETPPHLLAWQEETGHTGRGPMHAPDIPMQVDTCLYYNGEHYPGEQCPHLQVLVEPGQDYPAGWTV